MKGFSDKRIEKEIELENTRHTIAQMKGSTGEYGKAFEAQERRAIKQANGKNVYKDDFRAKGNCSYDALLYDNNGKRRAVELKTGCGALVYGKNAEESWTALEKLKNSDRIFVWDAFKDGNPFTFILGEFLRALEKYNEKGLATWFVYLPAAKTNARGAQLQFQTLKTSKKKMAYLETIAYEIGYDWETVKESGCLE